MAEDTICLLLSDLHFGKRTEDYDAAAASKRVEEIPAMLQPDKPPSSVFVWCVGDLAEGEGIWPSQTAENEIGALDQVRECAASLWAMLKGLHKRWPRARIRARFVRGNHGSIAKHAHPDSNLDLMIGDAVAASARGLPWCEVKVARGLSHVEEIGGVRIAALHRAEKHGATNAMLGRVLRRLRHYRADLLVAGHWHTASSWTIDGRLVYVTNGSLCGPDYYSEQLGVFDPPAQGYWTISDGRVGEIRWLRW
jgi:predicted phosphodiesterase